MGTLNARGGGRFKSAKCRHHRLVYLRQGMPEAFRRRTSNLFGLVWTYLQRCCHDPSRPLPRSVQPSQAIGPGRQRSGNLEEARRDGRGIPAIRRTARTDALRPARLSQRGICSLCWRALFTPTISPASSPWQAGALKKADTRRFGRAARGDLRHAHQSAIGVRYFA